VDILSALGFNRWGRATGIHVTDPSARSFFRYLPASERDRNWGVYVTTAGESRIGPQSVYPPQEHPEGYNFEWSRGRVLNDYQAVYISRGKGWFESRDGLQQVEAGQVMLLFPNVWHRYAPDTETGWNEHWVGFMGELPRRWNEHGFFSPDNPVLRAGREEVLLGLYTSLIEAMKTNPPALQQVLAGITSQILGQLYSAQQMRLTGDDHALGVVQSALARMQNELTERAGYRRTIEREL
jgi:hypothetical protein